MSRIGKKPVTLPKGVTLQVQGNTVAVKGPRGELREAVYTTLRANGMTDGEWLWTTAMTSGRRP